METEGLLNALGMRYVNILTNNWSPRLYLTNVWGLLVAMHVSIQKNLTLRTDKNKVNIVKKLFILARFPLIMIKGS